MPDPKKLSDEHFIVVAVRHTPEEAARFTTPLVQVRTAIHDAAQEYGLNVGDIAFRSDRETDITGHDITKPYGVIRDLYHEVLGRAKRVSQASRKMERQDGIPERRKPQETQQHRARALRALAVVEGYIEAHGDDLHRETKKKGRHAA